MCFQLSCNSKREPYTQHCVHMQTLQNQLMLLKCFYMYYLKFTINPKRKSCQVRHSVVFSTTWDKYSLVAHKLISGGLQAWPYITLNHTVRKLSCFKASDFTKESSQSDTSISSTSFYGLLIFFFFFNKERAKPQDSILSEIFLLEFNDIDLAWVLFCACVLWTPLIYGKCY